MISMPSRICAALKHKEIGYRSFLLQILNCHNYLMNETTPLLLRVLQGNDVF